MNSRPLETEKSVAYEAGERWIMAAGPSSIVGWPIVSSPDGQSICNLSWIGKKPDHITEEGFAAYRAKVEARGRLIASAPDLLEALNTTLSLLEIWRAWTPSHSTAHTDFESLPEVQKARAAISKARGQE